MEGTGAIAATMWLVRENELVRCEEIEEEVGALKKISVGDREQEEALRNAYENGETTVLADRPSDFDPMAPDPEKCRRVAFFPIYGLRQILGGIRLVFPPFREKDGAHRVSLARTLTGYYALYEAHRVLSVQHQERRDIDHLSKAILQLQHYIFSDDLPTVLVNSAMEIAPIDRAILLLADGDGNLHVEAVSGVVETENKGAWSKLVCQIGELVLDADDPVKYFPESEEQPAVQNGELRNELDSYALMTDTKSVLSYPLTSGEERAGVLIYETFSEEPPSSFEQVLLTIYASHAASAVCNHRLFDSMPLSGFYARSVADEGTETKRGPFQFGKYFKSAAVIILIAAVLWFAALHKVTEKVEAKCYVAPLHKRTVTAGVSGNIKKVSFDQGQIVEKGSPLIQFETRDFRLTLRKSREKASNLRARIAKLRGKAEKARASDRRGQELAELKALEHELAAQKAQTQLVQDKLDRCRVTAPITGTILNPQEPDQLVGTTVNKGEPLCIIGELSKRVKVKVAVPDGRVSEVGKGYEVRISLRSLIEIPTIEGEIEKIAVRSVTYKKSNVFMADVIVPRVAETEGQSKQVRRLQPGMTGKANILLPGKTTYASIYARKVYRKVKYWMF